MAERRIIEGRWACSQCDTKGILGRHKVCPSCGSPREAGESSFDFGERAADGSAVAATVTDTGALEQAGAGVDWHCIHCDAGNRGDASHCIRCGATREGERPPAPTRPPPPAPRSRWPLLAAVGGAFSSVAATCAGCLGLGWLNRDLEVEAQVTERLWFREVAVERLRAAPAVGWKDALPPAASPPGSGELKAGTGQVGPCEVKQCWPRPPDGGTTARVVGRHWERVASTRRMEEKRESGWKDRVPSTRGALPVAGSGGTEGVAQESCRRKEKTPERCREVSRKEQCGTERACKVKDLGNGFAEEVCNDVPKYCTVREEQCDPAVYDQWCDWTELRWRPGRRQVTSGDDTSPRWPALSAGPRERLDRASTNRLKLETLAGVQSDGVDVDESQLKQIADGVLVFVDGSSVQVAAPALQARGERVDCGTGIPRDRLVERESCAYELWSWVATKTLVEKGRTTPDWPDGKLGDDGRESRREWVEVDLGWERGELAGAHHLELEPASWEAWAIGTAVPVVVDSEARFVRFPERE